MHTIACILNALRLPFQFDTAQILQELAQFSQEDYYDIYNPSVTLETLWSKQFIEPHRQENEQIVFQPNEALQRCPYLLSIFHQFECDKETFRVHTLEAGASIKAHRDIGYRLEDGKVRLHIPVQTNADVAILLEGEKVTMHPGECWYCNFHITHEVHNRSDQHRIHLIIDCLVNPWLESLFEKAQIS